MKKVINSTITVDDFIKELQSLNATYRSKPLVIRTPNGEFHEPKIKQLLDDDMNVFGGWENMVAAIIQY